ncbi:LOW QUALITY PROTEIN: L-asparaginase-like [Pollicipes pollicipes]|uniref:LOW QUALITY PROTEIN: L-asparaginase-like n=1 Tax=Pollicipes pollicipes TaxID=41117 RepID=UPI0018856A55|nr:LOW QUALITY PROTEIN: L-asparaginase-like [Pollicipes pollicipes]
MLSPVSLEFETEEDNSQWVDASYVNKLPRRSFAGAGTIDLQDLTESDSSVERRVLVLYTGGTIGMVRNQDNVLAPCPGVMENRLRTYPNMHDREYAGQRFRQADTAALVLPPANASDSRVIYTVYEYDPLLDSSNMTMDDWIRIAKDVKQAYNWFDGFVILHGTDTMAYTASALSFMLENLGKSVIITGSQIPIFETRSDGRDNFLVALLLAGQFTIPEVTVFFNHELFRGNRTTKISTGKLSAFGSPNLSPLVSVGIDIEVDYRTIFRPTTIARFEVHSRLCRHVGLLRLFPSITTETVKAFLQEPIQGVVLQSYGAGNVPSNRKDLLDAFYQARQRGVIVVNCTQCSQGAVSATYETGKSLLDAGVLPGADMTPEAALTKLAYVLTKDEWDLETKRQKITQNLRGELTAHVDVELHDQDLVEAIARKMHMTSSGEVERLRETLYPAMLCSAAECGSIERIDALRNFGADVSSMDYDRRTPLHVAASEGNTAVLRHLLLHGASVHIRDRSGATHSPLGRGSSSGSTASAYWWTAAPILSMAPAHLGGTLFPVVTPTSAKPDATGRTALHVAALSGNADICRLLLAYGVSPAAKDMLGFTPAAYARMAGNHDLQRELDQSGVSLQANGRDALNGTPGLSTFLSSRCDEVLSREAAGSMRFLSSASEASGRARLLRDSSFDDNHSG